MSRKTIFTQELADAICARMSAGESLRSVCRDADMPCKATVMSWLQENPVFRDQYIRAREDLMEYWADEIVDIADEAETESASVQKARVRIDTRKWLMSKLAPKKYGDRQVTELSGPDGGPVEVSDMTDRQAAQKLWSVLVSGANAAASAEASDGDDDAE